MTERKEREFENLLDICRKIQKRFAAGYMPTFEQMDRFNAVLDIFGLELLCGHKMLDNCDCHESR